MNSRPMNLVRVLALAAAVLSGGGVTYAQTPRPAAPATAPSMSEGEVRKVDIDAQKITLRHGPIENLEMPSMTMVFRVSEPAMLQKVKVGDKVRFKADRVGGTITVVELEAAK